MDLGLADRLIVITGASSGIGLATAQLLYAEGALLAVCARRHEPLVEAMVAAGLESERYLAAPCDVRDPTQVANFVDAIADRFGRIDGLVNNAGASRMKSLSQVTWDDWRDELDLKFSGVWHPTMAAWPWLKRSDVAVVINVNALLAIQPDPRLITTSAARAGVLNLSKSLAAELVGDGIRVNSVCLGLIDTGQWRRRYDEAAASDTYEDWQSRIAADRGIGLGRFGRADEAAFAIASLLSPRMGYVTGAVLHVDGGQNRHVH